LDFPLEKTKDGEDLKKNKSSRRHGRKIGAGTGTIGDWEGGVKRSFS